MWEVGCIISRRGGLRLEGDLRRRRSTTSAADYFLSFGSVITGISLNGLCSLGSVLFRKTPHLSSLSARYFRGVGDLGINDLLVRNIDQGSQVNNGGSNERKAPKRNEFDQPVRYEGGSKSLRNQSVKTISW